ncbi:hypothetical protein N9596_03610 [Flavobacteriaceae bacterium]|nr:hypothetical protein [Flavobacteriaceae bacterium]MDB4179843.1 hypothetical protein [Flavobacteriaceae bacterium]|tara:strand:+ start:479 stop:823 length:345 start_codon:yes stop_codon:yes gene_type:complete
MKNSIKIFALLLLFSFNSNAQNNYQIKKATSFSEHAATQLDLSDEDQKFIYDTYIAKFMNDRENIFGKDLSKEERQAVYKTSSKKLRQSMKVRFDQPTTAAIMKAVLELQKRNQ